MYEKPRLNRVGDAEDVILGSACFGNDFDGTWMQQGDEYADDGEARN
jgi:hypothetical protein